MAEPIKKRAVRIILIPESIHKKLEKRAKEENVSVIGLTCRALIEYLSKKVPSKSKKNAPCKDKKNAEKK